MKSFLKKFLKIVGAVALFLIALYMLGATGFFFFLEMPILLLLGWPIFLGKIMPHVAVNSLLVGEGVLIVVVLGMGSHYFLVWLQENYGTPGEGQPPRPRWRLKWSLSGLAIFLLMFVTSISVTGFVHQSVWLATSAESLTVSSWSGMNTERIMRQVGAVLDGCREAHGSLPTHMDSTELQTVILPGDCSLQGRYRDGWGVPLAYTSDGNSYVLKSYGKNHVPGGGAGKFDDWIFSDGKFIFPITAGDTSP